MFKLLEVRLSLLAVTTLSIIRKLELPASIRERLVLILIDITQKLIPPSHCLEQVGRELGMSDIPISAKQRVHVTHSSWHDHIDGIQSISANHQRSPRILIEVAIISRCKVKLQNSE